MRKVRPLGHFCANCFLLNLAAKLRRFAQPRRASREECCNVVPPNLATGVGRNQPTRRAPESLIWGSALPADPFIPTATLAPSGLLKIYQVDDYVLGTQVTSQFLALYAARAKDDDF